MATKDLRAVFFRRDISVIFLTSVLKFTVTVFISLYSRICLIRHLKGIRNSDELCKQVKTLIITVRIFYHSNSYT